MRLAGCLAPHTSARRRIAAIEKKSTVAAQPQAPIAGLRGCCLLSISQSEYLALVDYTGGQIRPDKRGAISGPPPAVPDGLDSRDRGCAGAGGGTDLNDRLSGLLYSMASDGLAFSGTGRWCEALLTDFLLSSFSMAFRAIRPAGTTLTGKLGRPGSLWV